MKLTTTRFPVDIGTSSFEGGLQRVSGQHIADPTRRIAKVKRAKILMRPSKWVEHFIRVKDGSLGKDVRMSFTERRYLKRVYDTSSRKVLLLTSRQTEKSTSIGNILMARSALYNMHTSLFVTPSAMQTKVFSRARLDEIIDLSPMMKSLTHSKLVMNILEKELINRSKIYLRYAYLSADRIRGISAQDLYVDEIQDIYSDLMPVIEETTSHYAGSYKLYSGTPKGFDNTIEKYWANSSTQSEWCIPCEHHGLPGEPGTWHWCILGINNLGKHGPICDRCGNAINPEHFEARWVDMNPDAEFEGFRICRLMVPWYYKVPSAWADLLSLRERYPTAQFMNEVMALSHDSGSKPISKAEVISACDDTYKMDEDEVAALRQRCELYGGLDHGTGEGSSFTLLVVGGYPRPDASFQIVYAKRFDGPLADPILQEEELKRLIAKFRLDIVGCDYGMGFVPNKRLIDVFGAKRIQQFMYSPRLPVKIMYKAALHRFMVYRTPVMADVFAAIKRRLIRLPSWDVFQKPYSEDILSIHAEYSNTQRMIMYDKPRGISDDTFHAILFCFLASNCVYKRPDIMSPLRNVSLSDAARSAMEDAAATEILERLEPHPDGMDPG